MKAVGRPMMPTKLPSARPPAAALVRVSRSFPSVLALEEVTLTVANGDFVSIMGPSGSGKSTLLNILGLLDRPTAGHYCLGGIDTGKLTERNRSLLRGTMLGFVFQAFHLLQRLSVLENVMLGMAYSGIDRRERIRRAGHALAQVAMSHLAASYPRTLSGGERQRVAIARALAGRPEILLADEPTGNLDGANAAGILEVLSGLNQCGLTIILVTHDPSVAACASKRVAMREGRLEQVT
ncbi:MAG: ABC transporter ATP-binding protein [Bifidobacteriaceae bacterium]|nr:ABC transporter ATP-binding protein [Bifidobacteriaceae bacterium]